MKLDFWIEVYSKLSSAIEALIVKNLNKNWQLQNV